MGMEKPKGTVVFVNTPNTFPLFPNYPFLYVTKTVKEDWYNSRDVFVVQKSNPEETAFIN